MHLPPHLLFRPSRVSGVSGVSRRPALQVAEPGLRGAGDEDSDEGCWGRSPQNPVGDFPLSLSSLRSPLTWNMKGAPSRRTRSLVPYGAA